MRSHSSSPRVTVAVAAAFAAGLVLLPLAAPTAAASVPGGNGRIAFSRLVLLGEPEATTKVDIWVMDPDGTDLRNLTDSEAVHELDPAWSPDGTRIAYTGDVVDELGDTTNGLWVMDADGTDAVPLTDTAAFDSNAAWSPDGSRVAFSRQVDAEDSDVWVVDADGTDARQLTDNAFPDTEPAWSPDGTRIAYARGGELWVMDADGSDRRPLTELPNSGDPAWSPDGTRIAFERAVHQSGHGEPNQIWLVDADGTDLRNLSAPPIVGEFDLDPSWSPDGNRIVYTSDRVDNIVSIWTMDTDGARRQRLTVSPGLDADPDWQWIEPPASPRATTTALAGPGGDPRVGQAVSFEAAVSPPAATGTVTFADAGTPLAGCAVVPIVGGRASCSVTWHAAGTHHVSATYGGSGSHDPSTSDVLTVVVVGASTRLAVARAAYVPFTSVRVAATLVDAATDGGLVGQVVRFTAGSTPVCSAVTAANGTATCIGGLGARLAIQLRGSYTATFAGTPNLHPSTGTGPA